MVDEKEKESRVGRRGGGRLRLEGVEVLLGSVFVEEDEGRGVGGEEFEELGGGTF